MSARFITVEGIEGAGKSTAIATLQNWLQARDEDVVTTREPGGTALGEELREVLLSHRAGGMSGEAEVLLMFAARAEHLANVIRPALERGAWVVCDRFTDASIAYQGAGRGLGVERVEALGQWLHADLTPGLTLWLDVPVALGLERAAGRSKPDRFESEKSQFFHKIQSSYQAIAMQNQDRVRRVDASGSLADVEKTIEAVLEHHYALAGPV